MKRKFIKYPIMAASTSRIDWSKFDKAQKEVLRHCKRIGLDASLIANPAYSAEKNGEHGV